VPRRRPLQTLRHLLLSLLRRLQPLGRDGDRRVVGSAAPDAASARRHPPCPSPSATATAAAAAAAAHKLPQLLQQLPHLPPAGGVGGAGGKVGRGHEPGAALVGCCCSRGGGGC
jgi:hypothetical protein